MPDKHGTPGAPGRDGRDGRDRTSNRSEVFFLFKAPWRYQICISKCLNYYRDDLSEKIGKTIVQKWKKSTSGWRASLKNVFA